MKTQLPIPKEVFNLHIALLGATRSGKSSKMRVMIEYLLDTGQPVCIVDPKGDWYGLKSSADGKGAGYPVVIFGGDHADIEINEHSGALVAEVVATGNRPCIIDLGGWMTAARNKFMVEFLSVLFRLNKVRRYLAIDECHNFAPKLLLEKGGNAPTMLHWMNRIASEGAGKGILLLSASQRPQKVHNDYLSCHETLIACKVSFPRDREAVGDWMDGCADPVVIKDMLGKLAALTRPEAWVWSPEQRIGPEKFIWPMFKTFDSFKSPEPGEQKQEPTGWADIDLDDLKQKMGSAAVVASENDVGKLKARIAELEKHKPQQVGFTHAELDSAVADTLANVQEVIEQYSNEIVESLGKMFDEMTARVVGMNQAVQTERAIPVVPMLSKSKIESRVIAAVTGSLPRSKKKESSHGVLSNSMQRIIDAIVWWMAAVPGANYTRTQIAFVAKYKPGTGHYGNMLGELTRQGYIESPASGCLALTKAGIAAADKIMAPTTQQALQGMVLMMLDNPQAKVLAAVIKHKQLTRTDLAAATGYSEGTGHFGNILGSLNRIELIEYPRKGIVKAADFLYMKR